MATPRRIQMERDAEPEDIVTKDGAFLGRFMPGLGYWVTPENAHTCKKVLEDGRAKEVGAETAPLMGLNVAGGPGNVSGSISIETLIKKPSTKTKKAS